MKVRPENYLAVECVLLVYRTRENSDFENRHDLKSLLRESGNQDVMTIKY